MQHLLLQTSRILHGGQDVHQLLPLQVQLHDDINKKAYILYRVPLWHVHHVHGCQLYYVGSSPRHFRSYYCSFILIRRLMISSLIFRGDRVFFSLMLSLNLNKLLIVILMYLKSLSPCSERKALTDLSWRVLCWIIGTSIYW